jgi:membrane fusion protein (multidrug efflux system)
MSPAFVETTVVNPGPIRNFAELVGQLEAEESVEIRPEMSGVVEEILFEEGAFVQTGALLVRLRDDERKAELGEAREQLERRHPPPLSTGSRRCRSSPPRSSSA